MKCKILVVEDSDERFSDTEEHLNSLGMDLEIVRALSVDGALRRLKMRGFSLVILDIGLGADSARGNDLLPEIMDDPMLRNIPVIALSALNDQGVRDLCLREGAVDFFHRSSDEFRNGFVPKVRDLLDDCSNTR